MTAWADLDVDLLPPVLQDFVRLIGLAATMRIVDKHGGVRLYVPVNPTPEHHLAQLIGYDNLAKLSAVYGLQDHFHIPKAARALQQLRDAKIRADHADKSASELAREYGLGERHIWRILATADTPADAAQPGLFG